MMEEITPNTKTCTKCEVIKPFTEFHKDSAIKSGLKSWCKYCSKSKSKSYYKENREKSINKTEQWKIENRDKYLESLKRYRKNHPELRKAAKSQRRQAGKSKYCKQLIKEVNAFFKNCPKEMQVDHIIPLINENVCGLNVPCNLQYLSKLENGKKTNKFDFTYENQSWKLNG